MLRYGSSIRPITRSFNCVRYYSSKAPPAFFSEYLDGNNNNPQSSPIGTSASSSSTAASPQSIHQHQLQASPQGYNGGSRFATMRDITMIVSILTLSYFAVDNYRLRTELEQKHKELSLKHIRAIATQQNNFNNFRKKKELQMVNERKNIQKREMKMAYHISMLRKQLLDSGLKPVDIDEAIKEFEKNVKMETSISNVSGTALWVVDDSPMKAYVPSIHDYETKK